MASDTGRKGMGDKISEGVTPQSQKSTLEQGKEGATDAADKVAGTFQPSEDKNVGQKAMDSTSSSTSDDKGIFDKAKDAVGMGK